MVVTYFVSVRTVIELEVVGVLYLEVVLVVLVVLVNNKVCGMVCHVYMVV